jgi:hypothetical protein
MEHWGIRRRRVLTIALVWILAQPVKWLLWFELHLLLRDMQRAEHLADGLAGTVAGTEATVALHETISAR